MNRSQWQQALCIMVGIPLAGALSWAYSTGPTQPATGAPGEGTCADAGCHTSFAVNLVPGSLALTLVTSTPGQYTPGDTLDFAIVLQRPGQQRWGFQVTVIDGAGDPVGNIVVTDPSRTHVEVGPGGRQYLTHTAAGSDSGTVNTAPGWSFGWKAPAAGRGVVSFYLAGNAANGDGTGLGDYIYTAGMALSEGAAAVHESMDTRPRGFSLGPNYPNPFNGGTRLRFVLDRTAAGPVSLVVYDARGRRVRVLLATGFSGPGEHWLDWDGTDDRGLCAPSGMYLVRLHSRAGSGTRKVMLLR